MADLEAFRAKLAGLAADWAPAAERDFLATFDGLIAEVERLRAELGENVGVINLLRRQRDEAEAEVERLRAVLHEIGWSARGTPHSEWQSDIARRAIAASGEGDRA